MTDCRICRNQLAAMMIAQLVIRDRLDLPMVAYRMRRFGFKVGPRALAEHLKHIT